jgi:uncharacterized Zn-binding protein involved in type VI secretion
MCASVARKYDRFSCSLTDPGPALHVGGTLKATQSTVKANDMPVVCVGDLATCGLPPNAVAMGSRSVFIKGKPAARFGDKMTHGGTIVGGSDTVMIGG